jgi:hypothetical protein
MRSRKKQCGQARSFNPMGVNPIPARQASHRIENSGSAGVIPKIKHRGIKTAGRKRELNGWSLEILINRKDDSLA